MRARIIGTIIILSTLISCNKKDEYSLGEFRVDIATVNKIGENNYSLQLDNGKKLWPAASDIRYNSKDNQRVFINYTLLSGEYNGYDHLVKVNDIWNILTKDIVELNHENESEIGNDPIKINYIWVANDFLNIDFMFNYGGVRPHYINLVDVISDSNLEEEETKTLEFRHNSYNSESTRLSEGLVSFNLKSLRQIDVDSVNLTIKVKDWDEVKTYDLTYKYNTDNTQMHYMETPILVVASDEYE